MENIFKVHKLFKNKQVVTVLLFLYILLLLPFMGNIAFDAVVHFVVAQNFAEGHPFLYNLNDTDKVIASTSPFWTLLLTFFYFIAGEFAPLIVKSLCILLWLGCAYLLNIVCRDMWKLKDYTRYAVLLIWFVNVSIVKNSLGGLENILSAFQLLALYYFSWKNLQSQDRKTNYFIGSLLGWTILTRIDAGLLAVLFVVIYLIAKRSAVKYNFVSSMVTVFFIALLVLIPWYIYQYSYTSQLISDSSIARLFTGRRNSFALINGFLYFHTKAAVILLTAFLPLTLGFIITLFKSAFRNFKDNYFITSSILVVMCSVFAYSFVVGADQFGRYFLVCMPFFLVAGFNGLQTVHTFLKDRNAGYLKILVFLLVIFLFLTNAYDYYKRVINIEQLESNIYEVFYAPSHRNRLTTDYLQKLGFNPGQSIKLAITEVQFKYYVDERVHVLSLDGLSSPKIMKFMQPNGLPDFESFIEIEKPDVVEVKGWHYPGNLLFEWEEKISKMKLGESFAWESNTVTYVTPWHVKITYH